jgi:hypothetical protein
MPLRFREAKGRRSFAPAARYRREVARTQSPVTPRYGMPGSAPRVCSPLARESCSYEGRYRTPQTPQVRAPVTKIARMPAGSATWRRGRLVTLRHSWREAADSEAVYGCRLSN